MHKPNLISWRIVIMRPIQQSLALCEQIKILQGDPILLPMIEILPLSPNPQELLAWMGLLEQAQWVIVSSANAVRHAPDKLMEAIRQQSNLKSVTMGEATTRALVEKGIKIFFTHQMGGSSESLLQQPFLQAPSISGQNIVLLAGVGGRTLLADELQKRGAKIDWIKVYRQQSPNLNLESKLTQWQNQDRFCFIVTSHQCFNNLISHVPVSFWPWLKKQSFIGISDRILQQMKKWGAQQIYLANGASEAALMAALQAMSELCHTRA